MEFPSLNAAQLHHILREYEPQRSCPAAWTPSGDETSAAHTTGTYPHHQTSVMTHIRYFCGGVNTNTDVSGVYS